MFEKDAGMRKNPSSHLDSPEPACCHPIYA